MNKTPKLIQRVIDYCQKQVDADTEEAILWAQCKTFAQAALNEANKPNPTIDKIVTVLENGCHISQGL